MRIAEMGKWAPREHIEHACELLVTAESETDSQPQYRQAFAIMARAHVEIAIAKRHLGMAMEPPPDTSWMKDAEVRKDYGRD